MKIRMHRHVIAGVLAQLMNHPEQFNWAEWVSHGHLCGTVACIAGWIAELNCPYDQYGNYSLPSGGCTILPSSAAIRVLTEGLNPDDGKHRRFIHNFLYNFLFVPEHGHWKTNLVPTQYGTLELREASRRDAMARLQWLLDGLKPIQYIAPGLEVCPKLCDQYADLEIELV